MTAEKQINQVQAQNKFLARVYSWMTLALVISGVVGYLVAGMYLQEGDNIVKTALFGNSYSFMILAILEIVVVWWLSASIRKISAAFATVGFLFYSIINGVTISVIFLVYSGQSIIEIFAVSAVMFAVMAIYGSVTKTNLMSFGRYLMMGLIGILIASVLNMFLFKSGMFSLIVSVITVVLFTGLTAYDAQKLLRVSQNAQSIEEDVFQKASIIGALELYLDFINIFLTMLRLFGKKK